VSSARHVLDVRPVVGALVASSEEPGAVDPHFWQDPPRMLKAVDATAARLASIDAAHAGVYRQRAASLDAELRRLDREFASGLADCRRHEIVTSHAAFGYLASRYRL